jgi:hypothetical protein
MTKISLSNSFISVLKKDHCPRQAHAAFVLKTKTSNASTAMLKGVLFENLAFGLSEDIKADEYQRAQLMNLVIGDERKYFNSAEFGIGQQQRLFGDACNDLGIKKNTLDFDKEFVPMELRFKSGKGYRTDADRICKQVYEFYNHLESFNCTFESVQRKVTVPWHKNPDVTLTIKSDFEAIIEDHTKRDPLKVSIIGDTKLTGNVNSDWGHYSWGSPWTMDHSQAHMYNLVNLIETGIPKSFFYFVYDTAPEPGSKIIEKEFTKLEEYEINETIRSAVEVYKKNDDEGWPEEPEYKRCQGCLLKNTCTAYQKQNPSPSIIKI